MSFNVTLVLFILMILCRFLFNWFNYTEVFQST